MEIRKYYTLQFLSGYVIRIAFGIVRLTNTHNQGNKYLQRASDTQPR
jgi:hypothetical protein